MDQSSIEKWQISKKNPFFCRHWSVTTTFCLERTRTEYFTKVQTFQFYVSKLLLILCYGKKLKSKSEWSFQIYINQCILLNPRWIFGISFHGNFFWHSFPFGPYLLYMQGVYLVRCWAFWSQFKKCLKSSLVWKKCVLPFQFNYIKICISCDAPVIFPSAIVNACVPPLFPDSWVEE